MTKQEPITSAEYGAFQAAFEFFNAELFANTLPHAPVTLQGHEWAAGYYVTRLVFGAKLEYTMEHEIVLNPDSFTNCTDEEIWGCPVW